MFSVYKKYWNYHEDNIWSILVNKLANSKLCIRKIVYIYNKNDDSLMSNRFNKIDLINLLYRHQMFKKIFNNLDEKKYLIAEAEELISFFGDNEKFFNLTTQKEIREKYKNVFIDLIRNYNLSKKSKIIIFNFFQRYKN